MNTFNETMLLKLVTKDVCLRHVEPTYIFSSF